MIKVRQLFINLLVKEVVKTIYFEASVSRLYFTLDLINMESDLYILVKHSDLYRRNNTNEILTQIVDSKSSKCCVTMYNKTYE